MKTIAIFFNGRWTKVRWLVFRSWCGRRRVNGKDFLATKRFYYLSNTVSYL